MTRGVSAHFFFVGNVFRFVPAISFSWDLLIDSTICLDAPFSLDFVVLPSFAESAAPAAICCFLEVAFMIPKFDSLQRMRNPVIFCVLFARFSR